MPGATERAFRAKLEIYEFATHRVKYCGVSTENAWQIHEDALRDVKGLTELYKKICDVMGIVNETSALAAQMIKHVAFENLGLEDIDSNYLRVAKAAETTGVDLSGRFAPFHRSLSKFAHPTAVLVHGITHQPEFCRHLQAICTTQGVYFAAQSTLAVEAQLGIAPQLNSDFISVARGTEANPQ